MRAASTPSNAPPFMRWTLPLPLSSAGQPMTRTRPRTPSSVSRSARKAPTAAVPDPRQGVVLAEYRDDRSTRAGLGDKRRFETSGAALDRHLLRFEVIRKRSGGKPLLERELRPRVDLEREPIERFRARVDALADPLLARRGVQVGLRLPRTRR